MYIHVSAIDIEQLNVLFLILENKLYLPLGWQKPRSFLWQMLGLG